MSQPSRGIIFDLDGTLADTLTDIVSALNHALHQHHFAPARRDEVRAWIGDGVLALCRRAASGANEDVVASIRSAFSAIYRRDCLVATNLYPRAQETLAALHAAAIPMCVFSNKSDDFTRTIVAALCPAAWFVEVRGMRTESERKPSPVVALKLADAMQVVPRDVLFVGDSRTDIDTARSAGMIAVAVTWGFRDLPELRAVSPDHIIDRFDDLLPLAGLPAL